MRDDMVHVVAAVIERDARFLLGKRSVTKKSAAGYWAPVVGRIEHGESEEQAVIREVREEVGLEVFPVEKIASFPNGDRSAIIHWWRTVIVGDALARPMNDEHSEVRWVSVAEMRSLYPMFAEDIEVFAQLSQWARKLSASRITPGSSDHPRGAWNERVRAQSALRLLGTRAPAKLGTPPACISAACGFTTQP